MHLLFCGEFIFNMSNCNHGHSHQCNINTASDLFQSLDEMEFERGIWTAAQSGDLDRVKYLINNGNDVNRQDNAGYTALHYAARNGHLIVCQYLLNHGAFINAATRAGAATALHRACTTGKLDVVRYLLLEHADVRLKDADGKTALHRAAENKHEEIVKLLIDQAPDLKNIVDNKNNLASNYMDFEH